MIRPVNHLFLVALALFLCFTLPLISLGVDDIRMADVFSADEALAAATLRYLYQGGTFQLETFSYGGLFYYLPLFCLKVLGLSLEVTDRVVLVTLRMMCMVSGLGCLWCTFRLGRKISGNSAGVLAAFLLLVTPTFLRWSVELHPDLPQLFWMICALNCCHSLCLRYQWKMVCFGSLFAGLAAGTKYGGVFLLPVLVASVLLPGPDGPSLRTALNRLRNPGFLSGVATIPLVFSSVFMATNPYAILDFENFSRDVAFEREHLSFGHMFKTGRAGLSWIWNLVVLSGYVAAAMAALRAYATIVLEKGRMSSIWRILLLWIGGYTGYLVLTTNFQAMRHLLPVLVPLYILASDGALWLWGRIAVWSERFPRYTVISLFAVAILGWNVAGAADLFTTKWSRLDNSPEISAGRWIGSQYPGQTSVVFDAYAYVPAKFRSVFRTFGQSFPLINHLQPDVLVVRNSIADRYRNREDGTRFHKGVEVFLDHHLFYRHLLAGDLSNYQKVMAFPGVSIYERLAPKVEYATTESWTKRVILLGQGRLFGLPKARQEMGDVMASRGLWQDAAREFQLAIDMVPGSAVYLYKLGRMRLEMGDEEAGKTAFDKVWKLVEKEPDGYRAKVKHEMSRQFFATGVYDRALEYAQHALDLDSGHKAANFDIGLYHLAQGDMEPAMVVYERSVKRFGKDREAAENLRELGRLNQPGAPVARILNRHFGETP